MSPCVDIQPRRSDTVRAGATYADARGWDGVLFLPGDQPLVTRESFRALAEAFTRDPSRAYRLSWCGVPGSPVLFPARCIAGAYGVAGSDGGLIALQVGGARGVVDRGTRSVRLIERRIPAVSSASGKHVGSGVIWKSYRPLRVSAFRALHSCETYERRSLGEGSSSQSALAGFKCAAAGRFAGIRRIWRRARATELRSEGARLPRCSVIVGLVDDDEAVRVHEALGGDRAGDEFRVLREPPTSPR